MSEFETPSLRDIWESSQSVEQTELEKQASAHNMNVDDYLEKLAEAQVGKELQEKVAEENEFAYGELLSRGIKKGSANFFNKLAAGGGNATAVSNLKQLFCSDD